MTSTPEAEAWASPGTSFLLLHEALWLRVQAELYRLDYNLGLYVSDAWPWVSVI